MLLKRPHRRPRQKSPQLLDHTGSEEGCYHSSNFLPSGGISKQGTESARFADGLTKGTRFRRSSCGMMR
jgi:hypothetical protein